MKVEIYGEETVVEEDILRLKLAVKTSAIDGNSVVILQAVDKSGRKIGGGNLMWIKTDRTGHVTFSRASAVSDKLGLDLKHTQITVK